MLHPDNKNKTALEIALDGNRHRSFELMLHLLARFKHFPLSKMFLHALPHMVKADSELTYDFFNKKEFKPIMLEDALRVYWPVDYEEFIFVSHTSLITPQSLKKSLIEHGIISNE